MGFLQMPVSLGSYTDMGTVSHLDPARVLRPELD